MYGHQNIQRIEKKLHRMQWVAVGTLILLMLGMFVLVFGGVL